MENVKAEKKVVKKVIKEVTYERVVGKKGYFSVKKKDGGVILWAVRDNGNYLYYVVDERKREVGLMVLKKMKKTEEDEKMDIIN